MTARNQTEGDEMIFRSLRKIERLVIPEQVTSFHNIDADTLVLIVVRSLHCITGLDNQFPGALPPNIAQRHRICTGIATKIKEIGYKGDCGYNQLLYPAAGQTRSLLAWLVLQLPRCEEVRKIEDLGLTAMLNRKVSETLRDWKEQSWCNPNCLYGVPARNRYGIKPRRTLDAVGSHGVFDIYSDCSKLGISAEGTILERHSLELIRDCRSSSQLESDFDIEDNMGTNATSTSGPTPNSLKCIIANSIVTRLFDQTKQERPSTGSRVRVADDIPKNPAAVTFDRAACIIAAMLALDLEDHDAGVTRRLAEEESRMIERGTLEKKIQSDLLSLQSLKESNQENLLKLTYLGGKSSALSVESEDLEREVLIKRRTLELIPFAAENIVKLQDLCDAATAKLLELNQEWEYRGAPLERELQMKRDEKTKRHKKCHDQLEEIKSIKKEMTAIALDLKEKEAKALVLAREVEDLPDNLTRASYTHRILDIVTSLEKQTKEIDKIISDIRIIQKTLNVTRSALERADTIAEEMVFSSASNDVTDQVKMESYRRLRKFRSTFNDSIETVSRIGQLETAARELEAKLAVEQKRISIDNSNQIQFDLNEIRHENNELILMIKSAQDC